MKQRIYKSYEIDSDIINGNTIDKIVSNLIWIRKENNIPKEAKLDISFRDYYGVFEIGWYQEETDEEYAKRTEREAYLQRQKESEDFKTYLKLKEKFENPN